MRNFGKLSLNLAKASARSSGYSWVGLAGVSTFLLGVGGVAQCEEQELKTKTASIFLSTESKEKLAVYFETKKGKMTVSEIKCSEATDTSFIEEIDDILNTDMSVTPIGVLYSLNDTPLSILVDVNHRHKDEFTHTDLPIITLKPDSNTEGVWAKIIKERTTGKSKARFFAHIPDFETPEYKFKKITEDMDLKGTLCLDCDWEDESKTCSYERKDLCSFCHFMKGGPCRHAFQHWERCVAQNVEDLAYVKECAEKSQAVKKCVDKNAEYYDTCSHLSE